MFSYLKATVTQTQQTIQSHTHTRVIFSLLHFDFNHQTTYKQEVLLLAESFAKGQAPTPPALTECFPEKYRFF